MRLLCGVDGRIYRFEKVTFESATELCDVCWREGECRLVDEPDSEWVYWVCADCLEI